MGWYFFAGLFTFVIGFISGCRSTYSVIAKEIEQAKSIIIRGKLYLLCEKDNNR